MFPEVLMSKECIICYYQYFLNKGFKLQSSVFNGYHDVSTMSHNREEIPLFP